MSTETKKRGRPPVHGMSDVREYRVWLGMRSRCYNTKSTSYSSYGGRGIRVTERWSHFSQFMADMGPAPVDTSLDRIDNDGDYEPGNCRWATRSEQANNTRANRMVMLWGEWVTVGHYARIAQEPYAVALARAIKYGALRREEMNHG